MRVYVMDRCRRASGTRSAPAAGSGSAGWTPSRGIDADAGCRRRRPAAARARLSAPVLASPQDCGLAERRILRHLARARAAGRPAPDDARSLCFDGEPLTAPLAIVGTPTVGLRLAADRRRAMVAVRLCDVQPDGASTRITYGVLNLCHRNGHEQPAELEPGGRRRDCAEARRHRLQRRRRATGCALAISSTYWPLVWPSPEPVTLAIHAAELDLPLLRAGAGLRVAFAEPAGARPWRVETLRAASQQPHRRRATRRPAPSRSPSSTISARCATSSMAWSPARRRARAGPSIPPTPCRPRARRIGRRRLSRGSWSVRTETFTRMRSDLLKLSPDRPHIGL